VVREPFEGARLSVVHGHEPVAPHGADEHLGLRLRHVRRQRQDAEHERLAEPVDEGLVHVRDGHGLEVHGDQSRDLGDGAFLGRVHVHPQQVVVGEPVDERLVQPAVAIVAVGIVEKGADASAVDDGGIPLPMADAGSDDVECPRVRGLVDRSVCALLRSRHPHPAIPTIAIGSTISAA
jgi:hypothetical protein